MPLARVCTECGASLAGLAPSARTCTPKCRKARQRRLAAERREKKAQGPTVGAIVQRKAEDEVKAVLHEELRPIVREAIDDGVLNAVRQMVGLTPRAVEVLADELESEDPVLRDRAAQLVIKYTVGHPALVRPTEESPQPLQIIFGLPRPGDEPDEIADAESVEETSEDDTPATRVCDMCHLSKPVKCFVADSDRCEKCFREYRDTVLHSVL